MALPLGKDAVDRGVEVLRRLDVVRLNNRVLTAAGAMLPTELRSLDAIHLAGLGCAVGGGAEYRPRP